MKKYLILLLVAIAAISCEETVDVDLGTSKPRLVIDALIRWNRGTPGNEQQVRLSMTAPYFSEQVPPVSGAQVSVLDTEGNTFQFIEDGTTGVYKCNNFIPEIGREYTLTVISAGKTYMATEAMKAAPVITNLTQNDEGGFTGQDIEVRTFFSDNGATDDFYLFRFKPSYYAIPEYEVVEDRFFQGNEIFALYSDEDLDHGDELQVSIFGISQRYYNYMNILTSIAGSNGGSPFQSPSATVRGNIINTTNPDDYPLGFFAASEVDNRTYTVE